MRMVSASTTLLLLALGAAPAFGQAQPQELTQPTTQPLVTATTSGSSGAEGNQVICRSMYHNGSLIPERTCRTQREWESVRFRNQSDVSAMQMRGMSSTQTGK